MNLPIAYCKRRLGALWFVGTGLLYFVIVAQSVLDRYGAQVSEVWAWFLPTTLPTLTLISAVFIFDTVNKALARTVDSFVFWLTFWLSAFYLATIAITVFMQPFSGVPAVELMKRSNLWMGPFQGIVSAMLGIFFVKKT